MEFVQNTFVNMFGGSPEKALRAVLAVMGCYVLTAAPLVAWVIHGFFQKDPKVRWSSVFVLSRCIVFCSSHCLQVKEQAQSKAESQPQGTASDAALKLIRSRRSVFPKDYTGQLVSRYLSCCRHKLYSHTVCAVVFSVHEAYRLTGVCWIS